MTKAKPKKTTTQAPKKGGWMMVGENTKTGKRSVGGLTKDEAIKLAAEFQKDVHTIDTCILKERTPRRQKVRLRETKPVKQPEAAPSGP